MEKIESMLKDIGMREYEAKAFNIVVQCRVCSADQISKMARIPLTRVYETMQSLQKTGLVTVLNTRPKKYKLVSVDALSNILEQKRRSMEREIEKSSAVIKEIRSMIPKNVTNGTDEAREGFWIYKGRESTIRKISEESRKSRKEVFYFSDDFSWLPRIQKVLTDKIREGVPVKVLMNINSETTDTVKKLLDMGADVRAWDIKGLRGSVSDNKKVHLVSKIPRAGVNQEEQYGSEGTDEMFMYDCLATGNPIIVNMVKTYFNVFWWRGEKPTSTRMRNG